MQGDLIAIGVMVLQEEFALEVVKGKGNGGVGFVEGDLSGSGEGIG